MVAAFVVTRGASDSTESDLLAVVTVHDGPPLARDDLLAGDVGDRHNSFQEPEAFLAAGGRRGRQERVLVEGTYDINRLFATVELIKKTVIPVGFVGVVVSYTGRWGKDLSGAEYSHGELVETGCRGVWRDFMMPGKYAFNTHAGKIELVPTTNFVLMWQSGSSGSNFASLVDISIKENQGAALVKAAERRREEVSQLAQGDKFRLENEGAGRASAIRAIGEAEASAMKAKSDALEGEGADKQLMQTVMLRMAEAFEAAKVPLAPQIQLGGGNGSKSNAFGTLLALVSSMRARDRLGDARRNG